MDKSFGSGLDQAFSRTADGAFGVATDGTIFMWNGAAETMLGYSAQEAIGRHCCDLFAGRDDSGNLLCYEGCQVMARVKTGDAIQSFDMQTRNKAGHPVWLNISTLAVSPNGHGDLLTLHLFRDVTAAKSLSLGGGRDSSRQVETEIDREDFGRPPHGSVKARPLHCLVIVSKGRASAHGAIARHFTDARCEVIVDRRLVERRRGHHEWVSRERRRGERRSGRLEISKTAVIFVI
jgi:PAS domain S-box-containing protein